MKLIGISINHRTSPIELREAVHLSKDEQIEFILDKVSFLIAGNGNKNFKK